MSLKLILEDSMEFLTARLSDHRINNMSVEKDGDEIEFIVASPYMDPQIAWFNDLSCSFQLPPHQNMTEFPVAVNRLGDRIYVSDDQKEKKFPDGYDGMKDLESVHDWWTGNTIDNILGVAVNKIQNNGRYVLMMGFCEGHDATYALLSHDPEEQYRTDEDPFSIELADNVVDITRQGDTVYAFRRVSNGKYQSYAHGMDGKLVPGKTFNLLGSEQLEEPLFAVGKEGLIYTVRNGDHQSTLEVVDPEGKHPLTASLPFEHVDCVTGDPSGNGFFLAGKSMHYVRGEDGPVLPYQICKFSVE